jgi:hypothetical protein
MSPDSACSITSESLLPTLSEPAGEGYEVFRHHISIFIFVEKPNPKHALSGAAESLD